MTGTIKIGLYVVGAGVLAVGAFGIYNAWKRRQSGVGNSPVASASGSAADAVRNDAMRPAPEANTAGKGGLPSMLGVGATSSRVGEVVGMEFTEKDGRIGGFDA